MENDASTVLVETCTRCGKKLEGEEIERPFEGENGEVICDNCHTELFMEVCPICEDYYQKPTEPEETFFIVPKEDESQVGVVAGVYQVVKYPYYRASILGFDWLNEGTYKLLRACDINSMLSKIRGTKQELNAGECCPDCAEKYSKPKYNRILYFERFARVHKNINDRAIIKEGK